MLTARGSVQTETGALRLPSLQRVSTLRANTPRPERRCNGGTGGRWHMR